MRFHTTDGSIFHREYIVFTKLLQVTFKTSLTLINENDLLCFVFAHLLEDSTDLNA